MSHECSECERDLRGGHDVGCSRWANLHNCSDPDCLKCVAINNVMQFELFTPLHPLQEAIDHWRDLARQSRDRAQNCPDWDHPASHLAKAQIYEAAAQSLELELKTGVSHCACCLKPSGVRDA